MYDFDKAPLRKGTCSEKWSEKNIESICGNRNALPFWVADMDLITADGIRQTMLREAEHAVIGYREAEDLIPAFAGFVSARHDWVVDQSLTTYGQGMLHSIALAIDTFTAEGDSVLIPMPAYRPFISICSLSGRKIVPYHLPFRDGLFCFDKEEYLKASEGCSAILFCSPHNPSGMIFSKEELEFVLESAKERGQLVLSDEIHADLAHSGRRHYPMGKVNEGIKARCITFMAPSKSFNIAGEHCALAVFSDKDDLTRFRRRQSALFLTEPGYFIGAMAAAAYRDGLEYNRELCDYLKGNADLMRSYLEKDLPQVKMPNAEASFITFLDCSSLLPKVRADKEANPELYDGEHFLLSHFFGQRAGICMNDGSWFGDGYEGFVRFNYGCPRADVKLALEKLKAAVDSLYSQ